MQDLNINLVCHVTESLCTVNDSTFKELYLYIWNYFEARWETQLWNSRYIIILNYCTEMHDLSKNVNISRVCGSI